MPMISVCSCNDMVCSAHSGLAIHPLVCSLSHRLHTSCTSMVTEEGGQAQVELRLASTYTESKANLLNDVLEEFFFDDGSFWEAAPLPSGVRDVTYELISTMVGCNRALSAWILAWEGLACSMRA